MVLAHTRQQCQWKIPVMIGTNKNEMSTVSFFLNPSYSPVGMPSNLFSHLGYISLLSLTFNEHIERVLQQYPMCANAKENWKVYMDLMTDNVFKCPVRKLARSQKIAILHNFEYIQGYIQQGECARTCRHSTEISPLFGALPNTKKAHLSVSNGYGHQECIKLLYEHCAGVKIWLNPQYYMLGVK